MENNTQKSEVKVEVFASKRLKTNRLTQKTQKNYFDLGANVGVRGSLPSLYCPIYSSPSSFLPFYGQSYYMLWQSSLKRAKNEFYENAGELDFHLKRIKHEFMFFYALAGLPFPATSAQIITMFDMKSVNVGRLVKLRKVGLLSKPAGGGWCLSPNAFEVIKQINDRAVIIYNNRIQMLLQNDELL
jgi:hypothetical protein